MIRVTDIIAGKPLINHAFSISCSLLFPELYPLTSSVYVWWFVLDYQTLNGIVTNG